MGIFRELFREFYAPFFLSLNMILISAFLKALCLDRIAFNFCSACCLVIVAPCYVYNALKLVEW